MLENSRFDLFADAIGVRSPRPGDLVDEPLGADGLIVATDLVELLSGVAHDLAGLADVLQTLGQF